MKKTIIIILIALAGLGLLAFGGESSSSSSNTNKVQQVKEFEQIQQEVSSNNAKLYDVRTAQEFSGGKFEKAINLSLQDIQSGKMPEADKSSKIYIYCNSGNRSAQAKRLLEKAGFNNVEDLGGLDDVKSKGGKLI